VSGATGPSEESWSDGDGKGNEEVGGDKGDETAMGCADVHPPKKSTTGIATTAVKDFIFGKVGHVNERESTDV